AYRRDVRPARVPPAAGRDHRRQRAPPPRLGRGWRAAVRLAGLAAGLDAGLAGGARARRRAGGAGEDAQARDHARARARAGAERPGPRGHHDRDRAGDEDPARPRAGRPARQAGDAQGPRDRVDRARRFPRRGGDPGRGHPPGAAARPDLPTGARRRDADGELNMTEQSLLSNTSLISPFPPIAEYAFLSDCETCALVAPSGAVEWICLPRFDGPSVFGAMLECDPIFDYGRKYAEWEYTGPSYTEAVAATEGWPTKLTLTTDLRLGFEGSRARARTTLRDGDTAFVALAFSEHPGPRSYQEAYDRLVQTADFWHEWLSHGTFPDHPWRTFLQRSALTLKGLSYAPTGAMIA